MAGFECKAEDVAFAERLGNLLNGYTEQMLAEKMLPEEPGIGAVDSFAWYWWKRGYDECMEDMQGEHG